MTVGPLILALDTTLGACSVALGDGDSGILTSEYDERERGHAEALVPMIERVLIASGRPRGEISGVACTTGPGSFTGLRIGLAAAKGLALGLGVRLAGIPTLEALAASLLFGDIPPREAESTVAVIDGPRGGFITQAFTIDPAGNLITPIAEIEGLSEDQIPSTDFESVSLAVGPASRRFKRLSGRAGLKALDRQPEARVICRYVLEASHHLWSDNLSPIYFRPPHAEPAKPPPWVKPGTQLS